MNSIATDIASADFRVEADSKGQYDTFEKLYSVNVEKYLKQKKGDYLPWSMAWALFQHYRPDGVFEFEADRVFDSGEVEVVCTVTSLGRAIQCILPVLLNMKPVVNPSRHAINTARMRCLTKAIALHGLGLSCWNFVAIDEIDNPGDRLDSAKPEISEISEIKAAPKIQAEAEKKHISPETLGKLVAKIKTGEGTLKKAHDWFSTHNIEPTSEQLAEIVAAEMLRRQNEESNRETH
tara:strand:- start:328 stop:1035 length:708 start_codon:yes stop_codon:yes gene_type:complete